MVHCFGYDVVYCKLISYRRRAPVSFEDTVSTAVGIMISTCHSRMHHANIGLSRADGEQLAGTRAGDSARLLVELAVVVEEASPGLVGRRKGDRGALAIEGE
jgi:hypothetical protein